MDDLTRADGTRIAVRRRDGVGPAIVFLPGYASDMEGTKALALDAWALSKGHAFVRFDYGGCGASEGAFEDQSLDDWLSDVCAVIDATVGPVVLVGSSMGGWLMLLAALARPERVIGLIGIAAAPDFTDWGYSDAEKQVLLRDGRLEQPSPYGAPMLTTRALWQSGEALRVLDTPIAIHSPVRLIHGQADNDVPWDISMRIEARLRSADVQVILVKDGDHRLSREQDIALLIATLEQLLERL
jgi:pimeloyl-ACP methyl ester carboxylesterase